MSASRVMAKLSPPDFQIPMSGSQYEEFHRFVQESVVSVRTARVKIWDNRGTVIYSSDRAQVGQSFDIKYALAKALNGEAAASISVPRDVENERERLLGTLLEVYVPVSFPGSPQIVGSLEIYQYYAPFAKFVDRSNKTVLTFVMAAGLLFYLLVVFLVAGGWKTIQSQGREISLRYKQIDRLNQSLRGHVMERQKLLGALLELSRRAQSLPSGEETARNLTRDLRSLALQIEALSAIAEDPELSALLGSSGGKPV